MTIDKVIPALTNASSKYGADMGRSDQHDEESKFLPVVFLLMRLAWVDGDYDEGGAYWGASKGENIYRAYCADGVEYQIDLYKRAKSYQDAQEQVLNDYPLATFELVEDEAEKKYWFTSSCGYVEFQMTLAQAESVSHSGQCDDDVDELMKDPFIAGQLASIDPNKLRSEIEDYGFEDVSDHETNLRRILWLAGCDIRESYESQDEED